MNLLSPNVNTEFDIENPILYHYKKNNDKHSSQTLCSYILNTIGSFVAKCFDKRWVIPDRFKEGRPNLNMENLTALSHIC